MSWAYWGIVTGLLALMVTLVVYMDILSANSIKNRGTSTKAGGGLGNGQTQPPETNRRAA
jgi:hypothetical protein